MTDQEFRYLMQLYGSAQGPSTVGYGGDIRVQDSLPPPAVPYSTPSAAPDLRPGLGGPGSYPAASPPDYAPPGFAPFSPLAGGTTSGSNFWRNLAETFGGPTGPEQLGPQRPIGGPTGIYSTDPGVWDQAGLNPLPAPIPIGTGRVPPGGNQSAWAGTGVSQGNINWGNQLIGEQSGQQAQELMDRFGTRLAREGLLGGPGVNPNFPQFRPQGQFGPGNPEVTPIPDQPGGYTGGFDATPTDPRDIFDQNALGRGITPMPTDIYQDVYAGNPAPNETMYSTDQGYFPGDRPADYWSGNMPDTVYNPAPRENNYPNESNAYMPSNLNVATNDTMYPNDLGYFPPGNPPDFNNQNFPDTVYNPAPPENNYPAGQDYFDYTQASPGGDTSPATEFPTPGENWPYTYNIGDPIYDFTGGDVAASPDTSGGGYTGGAAGTPPTGYYGPVGPNSANGIFPDQPVLGNAPTVTSNFDPRSGRADFVPGEELSPSDRARIYNNQQFPGVSTGFHPGQFIKDTAGNILDATGRIVVSAAQAVGKLPGEIMDLARRAGGSLVNAGGALVNNVMNDPRNTDPAYLQSIGYHEQYTGEMLPGGVTGPTIGGYDVGAYGAGGGGGSYFHGGASAGAQHGATSVAGAFSGLGSSGPVNIAALGGNAFAKMLMDRLRRNSYWKGDQLWSKALAPARTFEGGPLPIPSIWGHGTNLTPPVAAGTPIRISNPAALFGGGGQDQVTRPLQQFGGRTGSGTPPVKAS